MAEQKQQANDVAVNLAAPLPKEIYRVICQSAQNRPKSAVLAEWLLRALPPEK